MAGWTSAVLLLFVFGTVELQVQQTPAPPSTSSDTCEAQWTVATDTNIPGGTYYSAATDVTSCRSACFVNPSCPGIDWDPYNPGGKKCFISGNGPNGTAPGVQHHFLNRNINCDCAPIWTRFDNTNVAGGAPVAAATNLTACQSACVGSSSCTGIDWDPNNPQGNKCWLLSSGSGQWNNGSSPGVTHYALDRNLNCQSCSPTFTAFLNTNVAGGTPTNDATSTLATCKAACVSLSTCMGIDWDPNNPRGLTCWTTGNGVLFNGTALGVTHYSINRNTTCQPQCAPLWLLFSNTNVAGGTPRSDANAGIVACQSACISSSSCTGIDWDPNNPQGNKCWLLSSGSGQWNNGSSPGVSHYALNRNANCNAGSGGSGTNATLCAASWTSTDNTNVLGGRRTADSTVDACKQSCFNNASCTGVDFNPTNADGRCYMSGPWSGARNTGTATGITRYDITRICGGPALSPCAASWVSADNTNVLGGKVTTDVTVDACKQSCFNDVTCTGVDFNPMNADGKCYLTGPWSGSRNNGTATGIRHYDITRICGGSSPQCTPTFVEFVNTNVLNGAVTSDASVYGCKQTCARNSSCTGVDWNNGATAGQQCFLSGAWSGIRNSGIAYGILHYDIDRVHCQGNVSACTPSWQRFDNTNVIRGSPTADSSLTLCQQSCLGNRSCSGVDWNDANDVAKCWLTGPWSGNRNDGTATGITHYDVVRSCNGTSVMSPPPLMTSTITTTVPRSNAPTAGMPNTAPA